MPTPRRLRALAPPERLETRSLMAASTLDPSFGAGGIVVGPVDIGAGPALSNATAVAVQADGKVVVAGTTARTLDGTLPSELVVARLDADGTLDPSFGSGGQVRVPLPSGYEKVATPPRNVLIQPDGSIVVAAGLNIVNYNSADSPTAISIAARITPGGALDPTFGTGGEYTFPASAGAVNALASGPGGTIIAAGQNGKTVLNVPTTGFSVTRLTASGAPDPAFNGTGELDIVPPQSSYFAYSYGTLVDLAVTPDGKVLLAGNVVSVYFTGHYSSSTGEVARVDADGTLDTSFDSDGILSFSGPSSLDRIGALAVQPDGKFLLAGVISSTGPDGSYASDVPVVARLDADGSLDTSFRATPHASSNAFPAKLAIGADGSITLGSNVSYGSGTSPVLERFLPNGLDDKGFGVGGQAILAVPSPLVALAAYNPSMLNTLALDASNRLVVAGGISTAGFGADPTHLGSQAFVARLLPIAARPPGLDYDGDGRSDLAAELAPIGAFAYRPSSGGSDLIQGFGFAGVGQTIPVSGDFDGDGKADVAAYLPALGAFAYRPSGGGGDAVVPFGIGGQGQTVPVSGDFDGDGKADLAAYLPAYGLFAYRPSGGGADVVEPFGLAGVDGSIPVSGDFDGDGKTDIAAYLPALGLFAYRPSGGGADVLVPFGVAGSGQTVPVSGDFDGDGVSDIAAYLPLQGVFAYRPSSGGPDVVERFGVAGAGQTIPASGDYDGDGKTDLAAYLPSQGVFAYRPSGGGADVLAAFGIAGAGQTVPASSIPYAQGPTTLTPIDSVAARSTSALAIPIPDDLLAVVATSPKGKKAHAHLG